MGRGSHSLAILVPKCLVLLDPADVFAVLLKCGRARGSARFLNRGVTLQDALERLVRRLRQGEHLLARPLDVLALVMPCEVGEAVDGFLSGAA